MSNGIGSVADQIVSFINSFMISGYTSMAGAAILFYDIISTIPEEVHFLWGQKRTSTIVIFHMNRWLTGTYMVLIVTSQCLTSWTIPSCVTLNYTTCTIALCIYTIWAAFSAIRVYALTGGNRLLSLVVALLNLVSVGTNAYYYFHSNDWQLSTFPLIGRQCVDYVYISVATNLSLVISTRVCAIVADIIVLLVTWSKTWVTVQLAREHHVKTPLMTMLLRDGTLYFLALLSLNVLDILGWTTNVFDNTGAFIIPLSSIIITHFLLNLRQLTCESGDEIFGPSLMRDGASTSVRSHTLTLQFGSFVGNMGESLVFNLNSDDTDLAWEEVDTQHDEHLLTSADIIFTSSSQNVASNNNGDSSFGRAVEDKESSCGAIAATELTV